MKAMSGNLLASFCYPCGISRKNNYDSKLHNVFAKNQTVGPNIK
jgi:hypothetical protein